MPCWSRVWAAGQQRTWTPRGKGAYAIVYALRTWEGHIGLQPVMVCTDHQLLQSWDKEHVDIPSGPAARRARWQETLAKLNPKLLYVPRQRNTVADCLRWWAYLASKCLAAISMHGNEAETAEAHRILEMEECLEHGDAHCFVVMGQKAEGTPGQRTVALAKQEASMARDRQAATEAWLLNTEAAPLTFGLAEDWDEEYTKSEYWATHWEASSKPGSELPWPAGLCVDNGKLFVFNKMLINDTRMDQVVHDWYKQQLLHQGLERRRLDMKGRFEFPPGLCRTLQAVFESCQVCQAVQPPNQSQAGNADWTPVPDVAMETVAIDKFAMPVVRDAKEVYDFGILWVDHHSGWRVAVPAWEKGLTADAAARQMRSHWITVFGTPKAIHSENESHFTGEWFHTMCRLPGVRHARTVAYHSRSNGQAEVARRHLFERLMNLHLEHPGCNSLKTMWCAIQCRAGSAVGDSGEGTGL